jgi:hypothetical protein
MRSGIDYSKWMGRLIVSALAMSGAIVIAQEVLRDEELQVQHAECMLFGPQGEKFNMTLRNLHALSDLTGDVVGRIPKAAPGRNQIVPGGSRTDIFQQLDNLNTIDSHLFKAMMDNGVTPAAKTSDAEYIRRVTLDLTGRVPTYDRLVQFLNDPNPEKRARLADELLNSAEFTDKWTMYFADLFKNTVRTTQFNREPEGRNAFHYWIKQAVADNRPYNQIATTLIASDGGNNWEQGEINFNVGGFVTGSPGGGQDIFDQQAANVAETFLGISHENCILCHDGRRRLDALSVWGKQETRFESWQLAAFFGKTQTARIRTEPMVNKYYWRVADVNRADYPLNTTTGNRPARQPVGSIRNVVPEYPFTGEKPNPGEDYREALARFVTNDIQFSRAIVNYLWKEFFGRGIVDPVNQFDLMRLDPGNPPAPNAAAPNLGQLQPSNPALLDALASEFKQGGFNVKNFMRSVVLSEAYQLSSRYEGEWKPEYEKYFARKYVRRLWGEEIVDSVMQISNIGNRFNVNTFGTVNWAMQLPDVVNTGGGNFTSFLDAFLRGNRDDEDRRQDGSVAQVLNLMNDTIITSRARATGTGATASFARQLLNEFPQSAADNALVQKMFLTVLSRYPSDSEMSAALANMQGTSGTARQQRVEDLLWTLYNKVDFVFNY